MKAVRTFLRPLIVVVAVLCVMFQATAPAFAADARSFNAGNIISDGVFTNSNTMSASQIQSFFNSKVLTCDTYGTQPSELGGGTRAQWLAAHGVSVPITCLKDYFENPSTGENNFGKAIPAGAISAAQIVYNYAQQFGINPEVLITTLQKENGLVTDEWPTPREYTQAMGFGCPDNVAPGAPACDPNYGSFSAQIYQAARHFRGFFNNTPGWFIPFTTGVNSVRWSPDANCGAANVNIQNRSTVALYSYTPYQPNQAALNAQYGTGDACSAYGNRNFYLYFTDWFGSVYGGDPVSTNLQLTSPITTSPSNPVAGQTVTVSYTVKNTGATDVNYENSVLQCRYNTTSSCDSAYGGAVSIAAGASKTFTNTVTLPAGGSYTLVPFFLNGGIWYRYGVVSPVQNSLYVNAPDMRLTSAIVTSPDAPVIGQPFNVTYTVRNFGSQPAVYQDSVLQCRLDTSTGCDSAYTGALTLNPGEQRTFTNTVTPPADGHYVLIPYFLMNGNWYTYTSASPSLSLDLADLRLTGDISLSPSQPIPGQDVTATYTLKNFGTHTITYDYSVLQCRMNTTTSCDPHWDNGVTLAPGDSKTFTTTLSGLQAGSYQLTPYYLYGGHWYNFAKGTASANTTSVSIPRYVADMRLMGNITTSPSSPIPGNPITVSYTVKNFGSQPAIYQDSVLQCRLNTYTNCDSSYTGSLTIAPGATHDFSYTVTPSALSGTYTFTPYFMQNYDWHTYGQGAASANTGSVVVPDYAPDLRLTGNITTSPSSPIPGNNATVSYTLKNFGNQTVTYDGTVLQCRLNTYTVCDTDWQGSTTLAPGDTKSFTSTVTSLKSGSYQFVPYFYYNGRWFQFGQGAASANTAGLSVPNYTPDLRLTGDITTSPTSPTPGQDVTVSYSLKNFGSQTVTYDWSVLQCRLNTYTVCDPHWDAGVSLTPGQTKIFSTVLPALGAGAYRLTPYYLYNNQWFQFGQGAASANVKQFTI